MHPDAPVSRRKSLLLLTLAALLGASYGVLQAQQEPARVIEDGGGQEILQSIFVPHIPNAPFSLTLSTEWVRPLNNGGTFTTTNSRPIKRDSKGRIYQERWMLTPKGSKIPSRISWIQIGDPVAHTLYECSPSAHICELRTLRDTGNLRLQPERFTTGPLPDGRGNRTHEDLGAQYFAGLPVHGYRDTTTLNAGVMGNDAPMSTIREFRYSAELGFDLTSILDSPRLGRQIFTVTEITTTEPDPHFFSPPEGYKIVDYRKTSPPAQ